MSEEARVREVKRLFNRITPYYDRLNRILSARRDVSWRKFTVKRLPTNITRALDVAAGTGDIALEIAGSFPDVEVFGLDFVREMMKQAQVKTAMSGNSARINFIAGDALRLPFANSVFDAAIIAFGIRNIPRRLDALKEMARVVRPGGKVLVLEMTFLKNLKLKRFFHWYLDKIIPLLGSLIAGNRSAYRYLSDSIWDFIQPDELAGLFKDAGLKSVEAFPLTWGIAYLHEGIVQ